MKTFLMMVTFSFLGISAQARYIPGSECGLIDFADDFELTQEKFISMTVDSKLTPIQEIQVIETAGIDGDISIQEAISELIDRSEAGDVYYETGIFNGKAYDVVRYYPGGNPAGLVFKNGETSPLAYIADSDLVCIHKQ